MIKNSPFTAKPIDHTNQKASHRFPHHLHRPMPSGKELFNTSSIIKKYHLNTVCEEAKCPNRHECFSNRTATFLALGKFCTRNCGFCDIAYQKCPPPPDPTEPDRIAKSVQELDLAHAVITMVTRDDLLDQGAKHIATIIRTIREKTPQTTIEVLTSDFSAKRELLHIVLQERPEIFNHNIETVRSLTKQIRHKADYERSLAVLKMAKELYPSVFIKSGLMVGLGETLDEIIQALIDLKNIGCDIVTIGQYLQPSKHKLRVKEYIAPEQFQKIKQIGQSLGISFINCAPFVRSDYNAHVLLQQLQSNRQKK